MEKLVNYLVANREIKSEIVRKVLLSVDRAKYIQHKPYDDSPQSIGHGATISAPHMHAICLDIFADHIKPGAKVLDVGAGSGYLTTCFAKMVGESGKVVGIDRIPQLVELSRKNILSDYPTALEKNIIELYVGDGWKGWPQWAPYDVIHVGAAAETIPQSLIDQLSVGGRMLIPVGPNGGSQNLVQVDKSPNGNITQREVLGVRYVPLVKE